MTFKPQEHMMEIKGKDYLEVKWRIVWFRDTHPQGRITTDLILSNEKMVVFKATVFTDTGEVLAAGHGTAPTGGQGVWSDRAYEKAETAAIGRALAHAGFGTQFTDEDENGHLSDSPVARKQPVGSSSSANISKKPADGYKPGGEAHGFLQSFEIRCDGVESQQVFCEVKLTTTGKVVPVWAFSREEFVVQGYMDRDDPMWNKHGSGLTFFEATPKITLIANDMGYWDIKPNSLTHNALLSDSTEDIPL